MSSLVAAALLADARLPSGGHTHSATLEPALLGGMAPAAIPAYIAARLATVTLLEASAAALTWRRAEAMMTESSEVPAWSWEDVEWALDARTPAKAQRDSSRKLGRGLLRLAKNLVPNSQPIASLAASVRAPMRGTAFGVLAGALQVELRQALTLVCYDDVQAVSAAALKLLPIDPTDATLWVLQAQTHITNTVEKALLCTNPSELPALSAPLIEAWAQQHNARTTRLFTA